MSQTGDPEVLSAQGRHNLLSLCGIAIELAFRRHPESPPLCPDTSAGSTPVDSGSSRSSGISRVGVGVVSEGWGQREQKGEHAAGTVGMGGKSLTRLGRGSALWAGLVSLSRCSCASAGVAADSRTCKDPQKTEELLSLLQSSRGVSGLRPGPQVPTTPETLREPCIGSGQSPDCPDSQT